MLVVLFTAVGFFTHGTRLNVSSPLLSVPGLGTLRGINVDGGVTSWRGIPFAEPPVGARRWQPPVAHGGWGTAPLDATRWGPVCMQKRSDAANMSESCLFLNVATAGGGAKHSRPVMVWIHGGAYMNGFAQEPSHDAADLVRAAEGAVVVVECNYRLNIFGFLGAVELSTRTKGRGSGNFGIMDQQLCLRWVKDHIASFGGDGDDVTIFGESAGGNSVLHHLVQPASFELYTKAIMQSGSSAGKLTHSMTHAQGVFADSLRLAGCPDLACLLSKDATSVLEAGLAAAASQVFYSYGFGPTVDGVSLTDTPVMLIKSGDYNKAVPVVVGSNRDELQFFFLFLFTSIPMNLSEAQFDQIANSAGMTSTDLAAMKFVYRGPQFGGTYPYPADLGAYSLWYWMLMRSGTDAVAGPGTDGKGGLGTCSVQRLATLLKQGGTRDVFAYQFSKPVPIWPTAPGPATFAVHGAEIPFVFGTPYTPGTDEAALAAKVSKYWIQFATSGAPSSSDDVHWPSFVVGAGAVLQLDDTIVAQIGLRGDACAWQADYSAAGAVEKKVSPDDFVLFYNV